MQRLNYDSGRSLIVTEYSRQIHTSLPLQNCCGGNRCSLQEAKYTAESRRKQFTTDNLCMKRKYAYSIIPCA